MVLTTRLTEGKCNPADTMTNKYPIHAVLHLIHTNKHKLQFKRVFMLKNSLYWYASLLPTTHDPIPENFNKLNHPNRHFHFMSSLLALHHHFQHPHTHIVSLYPVHKRSESTLQSTARCSSLSHTSWSPPSTQTAYFIPRYMKKHKKERLFCPSTIQTGARETHHAPILSFIHLDRCIKWY